MSARLVIVSRMKQLWGSQAHFAAMLGLSRQVMQIRLKIVDSRPEVWPYWCVVLLIEPVWLHEPVQEREKPDALAMTKAAMRHGGEYHMYCRKGGRPAKR